MGQQGQDAAPGTKIAKTKITNRRSGQQAVTSNSITGKTTKIVNRPSGARPADDLG